jgi:hypothetical protein
MRDCEWVTDELCYERSIVFHSGFAFSSDYTLFVLMSADDRLATCAPLPVPTPFRFQHPLPAHSSIPPTSLPTPDARSIQALSRNPLSTLSRYQHPLQAHSSTPLTPISTPDLPYLQVIMQLSMACLALVMSAKIVIAEKCVVGQRYCGFHLRKMGTLLK